MNHADIQHVYSDLLDLYWPQDAPLSEMVIRDRLGKISNLMTPWTDSQWTRFVPDSFYEDKVLRSTLNHELFSQEYFQKLWEFIQDIKGNSLETDFSVLEVWAGNGNFGKLLQPAIGDIPIHITDPNLNAHDGVEKLGYWDAIEKHHPSLVIAVWPLIIADIDGGSMFIETLRNFPSVQWCILIWVPSRCQFHEDDFLDYRYSLGSSEEFFHISDLYELSNLQIGFSTKSPKISIKNTVNPLLLRDQWIDDISAIQQKKTFATSRTQFLYRHKPGWNPNFPSTTDDLVEEKIS